MFMKCKITVIVTFMLMVLSSMLSTALNIVEINNEIILKSTDIDDFYSLSSDGHILGYSTIPKTYNEIWTKEDGLVYENLENMIIGQKATGSYNMRYYYIHRGFLFFDTSTIPLGSTITSATLTFYGELDKSDTDFNIVIQKGYNDHPHKPLISNDYNKANYGENAGSLSTTNFIVNGENNIIINNPQNWITIGGITKFCIRSDRDINGVDPWLNSPGVDTYNEYIRINSNENSNYKPYLIVEYEPNNNPNTPSKPSGPTSGKTGVTYTFSTTTTDLEEDRIRYGWDWECDGSINKWSNFYNSGKVCSIDHIFEIEGDYCLRVLAEDEHGAQSEFSPALIININQDNEFYSLTISVSPEEGGFVEVKYNSNSYIVEDSQTFNDILKDTIVSLTECEADNWEFEGWSGDVSSEDQNLEDINIIIDSDKSIIANFAPVATTEIFNIIHITDLHFSGNSQDSQDAWEKILNNIKNQKPQPSFVVCTGDLVEAGDSTNGADAYQMMCEGLDGSKVTSNPNSGWFLKGTNIPIYFCPGNHDAYYMTGFNGDDFDNYRNYISQEYYYKRTINIDGYSILLYSLTSGMDTYMDTDFLPQGDGLRDRYGNEVTHFIEDTKLNADFKLALTHHPYVICSQNNGRFKYFNINGDGTVHDFGYYCENYNVDLVLAGHIHKSYVTSDYFGDGGGWVNGDLILKEGRKTTYVMTDSIGGTRDNDQDKGHYRKISFYSNGDIKVHGQQKFSSYSIDKSVDKPIKSILTGLLSKFQKIVTFLQDLIDNQESIIDERYIKNNNDCRYNIINIKNIKTTDEKKYYLGELEDTVIEPVGEKITGLTPSSWDWQNAEYKGITGNWMTSVKDQGSCGSCYAFGTLGAIETCIKMMNEDPNMNIDLSEQYMVSCGESWVGGIDGCQGSPISSTIKFLETYGAIPESCFSYQASEVSCNNKCHDWEQERFDITNLQRVSSDKESIKNALVNHGTLTASFRVYLDFKEYTGGIYEHQWGYSEGLHRIVLVGFNEDQDYWICKNSWGTSWGENGYFRIKYGECEIQDSVYYFELPTTTLVNVYPKSYHFGVVKAGECSSSHEFIIENRGAKIKRVEIWCPSDCFIVSNTGEFHLDPNEEYTVSAKYCPKYDVTKDSSSIYVRFYYEGGPETIEAVLKGGKTKPISREFFAFKYLKYVGVFLKISQDNTSL